MTERSPPFHARITAHMGDLTTAQKELARRLLDLGERVAFMTARQLGDAVGQSDAAIVRFAKALGYSGLPDMRESLRARLLDNIGSSGARLEAGDTNTFSQELVSSEAALAEETGRLNDADVMSQVADRLIAARRICVSGHGTTYPMAVYLAMHLNQSLDTARVFNIEHGDLADRFRSVGPGDVFVGIGYARYLPYTIDILKLARDAGATIIAITDRVTSPLAALADFTLYAGRANTSQAAWWSQIGTMVLADWLNALVLTRHAGAAEKLKRSDEEWSRLGHWKGDRDLSLDQHRRRSLKTDQSST